MIDDLIKQFKELLFQNKSIPATKQIDNKHEIKSETKQIKGFVPPIKGTYYNSGNFSPGVATDKNHAKGHDGIDVRAEKGAVAQSMSDGIIKQVSNTPKGGLNVVIQFDNKFKAYYAHLDSITVKNGQRVKAGEQIGTVGNTGNAKGGVAHIHLQIWNPSGSLINPASLFSFPKYTAYTKEERVRDKAKKAVASCTS